MNTYDVIYELCGTRIQVTIEAVNPGSALEKCRRKYPAAKLIRCQAYRKWPTGEEMWINYDPPSLIQVEPLPEVRLEQTEMELK